ncbi:ArsR family transcriptional regulator [Nocardioides glacieisoli]|uniref:ArsR family transcriptional regulator n=1 Tax=Nocardioides glacieisoli TaxID=1168730 RepID=A0A4Q2S2V3_9ACTN|nr:helix-turn-helix domain-containing protein [Nocardioides glacieisoli]RYB96041.1 ArsR family transcriptional regulator [Nocardioides glacieisoli]
MITDQSTRGGGSRELDRRVRVHAALADSTRLRITDHLAYGDASPTELQALLGIPSNLLAHHLGVLGEAGVVTRRRSEADRRRSYVRLLPDALDGLLPRNGTTVSRVVFVCTANSARSQLAAALWARVSAVPVASAGTHPAGRIAAGALEVAGRRGVALGQAQPLPFADVVRPDDYLVTVCDNAHEELHQTSSDLPSLAMGLHWSIPDPVRVATAAAFDAAFDELNQRVIHLAPHLTAV